MLAVWISHFLLQLPHILHLSHNELIVNICLTEGLYTVAVNWWTIHLNSVPIHSSFFSKWIDFRPIGWIRGIGQSEPCMNWDSITASQKHIKHSSVITLQEHQRILTNATTSINSDIGNALGQWQNIYFKASLLFQ